MSHLVREAIDRYERRMPGAARAAALDPVHHHLAAWTKHMLCLAELVMEDEGVPEETRARVIRGVLYGSPNPADAALREEQRETLLHHLNTTPPTMTVVVPEGWKMP